MSALCYFREIFGFALPIYIANLFQQFYHATDTIIIGNLLGEQVLAAVGAVSAMNRASQPFPERSCQTELT